MKITILSPGPSLAEAKRPCAGCDVVIGVNRAVAAHRCDWWVFGDWQTLDLFTPLGRPQMFTIRGAADHMRRRGRGSRDLWVVEDIARPYGLTWAQMTYSVNAALLLAVHLGWGCDGTEINVYGHDMRGDTDFTGEVSAGRGDDRWRRERERWYWMTAWAQSQGARVTRHGHA